MKPECHESRASQLVRARAWLMHHSRARSCAALLVVGSFSLAGPTLAQSTYGTAYTFTTFAGWPGVGSADGVGNNAQFNQPWGAAVDGAGNVYVTDTGNSTIRRITPAGVATTVAGFAGSLGSNDGAGSNARFYSPAGVAVDGAGNLYVGDMGNNTIRKVTPAGVVSTIAGLAGVVGTNDGAGSNARFYSPAGVAVDSAINVYVADSYNDSIRKITPVGTNWVVSTLAGGASGTNDGVGSAARFIVPTGVALDAATNVYVADSYSDTIRKITPGGVVSTLAGLGNTRGTNDGVGSAARFWQPSDVAVDSAGDVFVADTYNSTIRKITPAGVVSTLAGLAETIGSADGTGSSALFSRPTGVAVDSAGNVYVEDTDNSTIRKVTPVGVVSTLAGSVGSSGAADGTGSSARFYDPRGVAVDGAGNVYLGDFQNHTIRKITLAGVVSTLAGLAGASGTNDGVGNTARFYYPQGVAVDRAGNVYVADSENFSIRKVTPFGQVSTLAGGGYGTNDGPGSAAQFSSPEGVAVDNATNVYVADTDNSTIRKITPSGVVSTLAGSPQSSGTNDGPGSAALFYQPEAVAVDTTGNVYVADTFNHTIRKITPAGVVSTLAGGGYGTNDGTGSAARFYLPEGVAVDSAGNVFVADTVGTIRKVTPAGVVSTLGGSAYSSGSADGTGGGARFNNPYSVAVDSEGSLYVADSFNNTIRKGTFTQYATTNPVPYTPPAPTGQLVVTLTPANANGQWRLPWELRWRNSREVASGLAAGNYFIQCRNLPGWVVIPFCCTVSVTNNGTTYVTNQYYPTLGSLDTNSGSLTVNIGPSPPPGAGWHFVGDTTPAFPPGYPPGFSTNLQAGTYLIEFAPITNYSRPPTLSVPILPGQPTVISVNYTLASAKPDQVLFPFPVPPGSIADLTDYPFGFNGQLQTDEGYGSGVVVQPNVVLTVAHLVFNDQTLSYVGQAYWYFQQETGVYSPQPLTARGWYVLSGYAGQRTNDLGHGYGVNQSSAASRNLDVAALYFPTPAPQVPWGGYGGYLPSDVTPNPWLTGNSLKMLVGYPVDGSFFGDTSISNGVMYQTDPQPYPLTISPEQVNNQQVYTAPWFLSYPGASGGPLYVQLNGYYYPAAVYLGTLYNGSTYQSLVRAIDSDVVNLITNAAAIGVGGTNNTGGGVITFVPNQAINANNQAYVQVLLGPPAAVQAGAGWQLSGDPPGAFGNTAAYMRAIATNGATIVFNTNVPGWNPPVSQTNQLIAGTNNIFTAFYTVTNPVLVVNRGQSLSLTGTTGTTYILQYRTSMVTGSWQPLRTNTLTNGLNLLLPWPPINGPAAFYRVVWLP